MKQLINRPMLLAALLTVPLWIVFSNFVVAAMVALLISFFASMVHSLRVLKRHDAQAPQPSRSRDGKKTLDK